MEQKNINNINISVDDGEAFFCHEMSISYNPMQLILDFKSVTPRVDMRSKQGPSISVKHNVVLLDPFHAKQMLHLLNKVVTDYEADFGEIKKPESIEKAEQKIKDRQANAEPKTVSTPSYFG
ncbi:MAG: DUF3467 domain-containing protein [Candidatus Woesearchaeota archaeon]